LDTEARREKEGRGHEKAKLAELDPRKEQRAAAKQFRGTWGIAEKRN
jgi:hypothetical protein